jgi:hypothetical protein
MVESQESSIKDLREAATRGRQASQELESVKREMAFLKAGVDTDSKAGQLLFKAYDGDLEADLIRAEAEELGILKGAAASEGISEADEAADRQVGRQRQNLVSDSVPPDEQIESPYEAGHREFREMIEAGRPKEDSAARFIDTVLQAAGGPNPDPRVISKR